MSSAYHGTNMAAALNKKILVVRVAFAQTRETIGQIALSSM